MRRLYIHIGMAKAGSTAIQKALLSKEEELKSLGILNPRTGRRRGAHWDLAREIGQWREPNFFPMLSSESREYPTTVITCESFWIFPEECINRLREITSEWDVRVIAYLRRPGDYLGSSYRQHIKSGKAPGTPKEFVATSGYRLVYDGMVRRWSQAFPMRLRVYDAVRSRIEQDFFDLIGAGGLNPERFVVNGTPPDGATRVMLAASKIFSTRSRRQKINQRLLAMQNCFKWLPPLDNNEFQQAGRRAVESWDRDLLLSFLSEDELNTLMQHSTSAV